jgi:hypothetical protein
MQRQLEEYDNNVEVATVGEQSKESLEREYKKYLSD